MPLTIDYWSDPLCIWAYVAEDKLRHLEQRFGDRIRLQWRVVPVFGDIPARFATGVWQGGPEGKAALTVRVAQKFGHDEVTGRVWVDDTPASSWAPAAAFEAVRAAEARGELADGSAARWLRHLRRAFFVDNRNIARRDVQRACAEEMGLPWDAVAAGLDDGSALAGVWSSHEERQKLGIQGSPTWVFDGGRAVLYGNVHEGVLLATVAELLGGAEAGCSSC